MVDSQQKSTSLKPRTWSWLVPEGNPWILSVFSLGVLYVLFAFLLLHGPVTKNLALWRFTLTAVILIVFLFGALYFENLKKLFLSQNTGTWILLILLGALSNASGWVGKNLVDEYLMLILVFLAAMHLRFASALVYNLFLYIAWLFMNFIVWQLSFKDVLAFAFAFLPGLVLLFGFGKVLNALEVKKREVEDQKKHTDLLLAEAELKRTALKAAQKKEHRLGVTRQRVQMAGQIHDDLNGAMKALLTQLNAAKKSIETNNAKTFELIELCRAQTKSALKSVRTSVAALRDEPQDSRKTKENQMR